MATETAVKKRHPGRRPRAPEKTVNKHKRLILEAEKKRRDLEAKAKAQTGVLAGRIDTAMDAGVETNFIADTLGISRQMVYKLVRERVDGRPLGNPKKGPSQNGAKGS